ncbi:MAG: Vitamin B12 dependent methionine synthase activation subunit [Clostridiales bacterium]|nr:Vitamin B12 dependent methionine synthase activation subunit [Clostridiales bacterium]
MQAGVTAGAVYRWRVGRTDIPLKGVARYLGYAGHAPDECDNARILRGVERVRDVMDGRACYGLYDITVGEDRVDLPYGTVRSASLAKWLRGCGRAYMFAATIGAGFDRMLRRAALSSMAEAAVLQACGAAAVEHVCDLLNGELDAKARAEGYVPVRRYSPGYGDFALDNQRGFFRVLDPGRWIGLSLMDTLIMSPEKSVTAIIGLKDMATDRQE